MYWKKIGGPLLDRIPIRLHIDPSEGVRKTYSLEELQSYVKKATEKSREIGTSFRDLSEEQALSMIPNDIFNRLVNNAISLGWSDRRRFDLYKIWFTIVSIFGDDEEKYGEYLDKALSIMGDFAFPN